MINDKELRKLLFGWYSSEGGGSGKFIVLHQNGEKTKIRKDDGIVFYLLDRINKLEERVDELSKKNK